LNSTVSPGKRLNPEGYESISRGSFTSKGIVTDGQTYANKLNPIPEMSRTAISPRGITLPAILMHRNFFLIKVNRIVVFKFSVTFFY